MSHTKAQPILADTTYPWEALLHIGDFVAELGKSLDKQRYSLHGENIWIAKTAAVDISAHIDGPCIIDEETEVRHCAYIRGNVIIGKKCVIGNSTEVKNSIIFDKVQIPHYNYVGDSVLGYRSHLGAGAVTSNVKSDKSLVTVLHKKEKIQTGLKKFGAILGDYSEVGCHAVLCPGSVVGRNCTIYPTSMVRGYVEQNSIYKDKDNIIKKE